LPTLPPPTPNQNIETARADAEPIENLLGGTTDDSSPSSIISGSERLRANEGIPDGRIKAAFADLATALGLDKNEGDLETSRPSLHQFRDALMQHNPVHYWGQDQRVRGWEEREKRKVKQEFHEDEPSYETKRSRLWPGQQLALDWMSQAGKRHFDIHLADYLADWGVTRMHTGTCVFGAVGWVALPSLKLASLF